MGSVLRVCQTDGRPPSARAWLDGPRFEAFTKQPSTELRWTAREVARLACWRGVRACRACADVLPLGPRPVVQISATARILIASQAPGTKVHESGIPFSDASGDRCANGWACRTRHSMTSAGSRSCQWDCAIPDACRAAATRLRVPNARRSGVTGCSRTCQDLRLTLLVGAHAQKDELGPGQDVREGDSFSRSPARPFPAAASLVAQPALGGEEPVVRRGGASCAPRRGSTGARLTPVERPPVYTVGHSTGASPNSSNC